MTGAIIMLVFVIVVANVGGLYFWLQDKKQMHQTKK